MPSSSSAKKVARVAARSGSGNPSGATNANSRNWLFAAAIVAIVVLGLGVVVIARNTFTDSQSNTDAPRANINDGKPFDHWHSAFAMNVCGKELPPLAQPATDPLGIHTHGDGLIHIHPFTVNASGKHATMKKFWDLTNLKVTNDGFKDPATDKVYKAGETTCGGKPTELVMAFWKNGETAASTKPDKFFTKDFNNVNYTDNLSAYTLALVVKGDRNVPAPSSAANIAQLGAADGGTTSGNAPTQDTSGSPVTVPATVPSTGESGSGG
jgi:hypothetical protein